MILSKSDFRYTFRQLAKNPGFALLSVLVLAGGLGISLFTFSMSYTMAYKPIDLPNGERTVEVCGEGPFGSCLPFKAFEFASFRDEITTLENVGVYTATRLYVQSEEVFHQAAVTETQWNMFELSGTTALLGRTLQEFDQQPQAQPVAVLAHDFWELAFDGSTAILDTTIDLGGVATRIIGVMPPGYKFPRWSDIWIPATPALLDPAVNSMSLVTPYGLVKQGVPESAADAEIASLVNRMREQYPPDPAFEYEGVRGIINELDSGLVSTLPYESFGNLGNQLALFVLNSLAVILFLLACINVGTLLLARTNERLKDISIRVALGAPRLRLLTQTMGETLVIAIVGTLLAILFAGICMEALNIFLKALLSEEGLQFWMVFEVDGFTVGTAIIFSVLTVLCTSALPAWKLINGNFNSVMQDGTRGAVGLKTGRFSKSLVIISISLIAIFLYTMTMFTAVTWNMGGTYRLVDAEGIYSVEIETGEQFRNAEERRQFFLNLQSTLANNSNVSDVLMIGVAGESSLGLEGVSYFTEEDKPTSPIQILAGDLNIIGASLLEGRYLNPLDNEAGTRSALVSLSLAQRLWPDQSPIGENLHISDPRVSTAVTTFNVVGMTSNSPIDGEDMSSQESDMVYLPLGQMDSTQITAIIRSPASEQAATKVLGDTVLGLNSGVDLSILSWVENRQMISFVVTSMVVVFAGVSGFAFLVSVAGVFGLTQNSVLLRTQEIGTRRALGATDTMIGRSFTLDGARQVLMGILCAILICAPVTYLIYIAAGPEYLISGASVTLAALILLVLCVLAAIHYPIKSILRKEPSELLHHQ